MSQPTPYVPATSFSDHTANLPDIPQDGTDMDAEFQAIKTTLDETLTNLAIIQRDDGNLANGVVTTDSLDPLLAAQLGASEVWVTATEYEVGDDVFFGNGIYRCATAHTSGTFLTDLAAAKWTVLLDFSSAVLSSTSATSTLMATGAKVFTTQADKYFRAGDYIAIQSDANPTGNVMFATVTSYAGTTLTTSVFLVVGAGTYADWTIRVSGPRGATGAGGTLDFAALSSETVVDPSNDQLVIFDASEGGGTNNKITPIAFLSGVTTPLTEDTTPDGTADFIPTYDTSATTMKKVKPHSILSTVTGLTADATPVGTADYLLSYDASASLPKKVLINDVYKTVNDLTEDTDPDMNFDFIPYYKVVGSVPRKTKPVNILKGINTLTEDTSPDTAADFILSYDTSAGTVKKVKPDNLLGSSSGRLIDVQTFTASGTWTKPALTTKVRVTVVGGGGGGAAGQNPSTGGTGGTSSFGAFCSATGGAGGSATGTAGNIIFAGLGGAGGVGSGGDEIGEGQDGASGGGCNDGTNDFLAIGGTGGSSIRGGGGRGASVASSTSGGATAAGLAGNRYGGGGGGGATAGTIGGGGGGGGGYAIEYITSGLGSSETVTVGAAGSAGAGSPAGGAGAAGIVIVESYT